MEPTRLSWASICDGSMMVRPFRFTAYLTDSPPRSRTISTLPFGEATITSRASTLAAEAKKATVQAIDATKNEQMFRTGGRLEFSLQPKSNGNAELSCSQNLPAFVGT